MAHRILLVEDEENLRSAIRLNLEMEGYEVTEARDGKIAFDQFRSAHFDLIILDVMLPEMDGYTLCRKIRLENTKVPVIFLTAKGASDERVQGLKLGADDYLAKPFNLEELLLRVGSLLRRGITSQEGKSEMNTYRFGKCEINFLTFDVFGRDEKKRSLPKREIQLLKLLIERKNEVVSREDILRTVWEYDVYPSTRTIDNYIVNFRKYFEKNPREPKHFFSVRGVGYKFND
ncbi:MAG: response regulator transcription factor [Bacteroidetes bacterium]|nr:MAG: response regulator transcription factor [Bacteroidota bacterium]